MPKEIYLGVPTKKVTLRNIVEDGSFEGNGWTLTSTTFDSAVSRFGSRSLKASGGTGGVIQQKFANPVVGHKYYGQYQVITAGATQITDGRFELWESDTNTQVFNNLGLYPNTHFSNWTILSGIVEFATISKDVWLRAIFGSAKADVWIDGVVVIDLTEAFGAGDEPTKEWCDANIPFFEGTKTIEAPLATSVARTIKEIYLGVGGVARKIVKSYIGVDGVARLCYEGGIPLYNLPEGALVKLNENGVGVNFYLAKHDYESALNGAGRSLLVRQDCFDNRAWDAANSNAYASSDIDAWLNGEYKNLLDDSVRNAIGTTSFYYTPGAGDKTVTTLSRSVFLLSVTELGLSSTDANAEGSKLPTATKIRSAYLNGSRVEQLTRTPYKDNTWTVICTDRYGVGVTNYNADAVKGSRPVFTLPASAIVIPTPNADGSYTLSV